MKKLFLAALIMCVFFTSISFVSADGGDVEFFKQTIENYDDLMACGSIAAAKEKGLYRSEGKEYVFQDGDVVLFRFNV